MARFNLSRIPATCTIFALRLTLSQTRHVVPLDDFVADNLTEIATEHKPDNLEIYSQGQIPKASRPGVDLPALWRGSEVKARPPGKGDDTEDSTFSLDTGKIRMPHEKQIRPSTAEGSVVRLATTKSSKGVLTRSGTHSTLTPIRFHHSIALRLFFSIKGRTIDDGIIEGDDQDGDLRMLVVSMRVRMPSVRTASLPAVRIAVR